jgi:hypothetical protein
VPINPLAATVTPYTAVPSVRYSASDAVGEIVASIGIPRELNMMHAVPPMSAPALFVHRGA